MTQSSAYSQNVWALVKQSKTRTTGMLCFILCLFYIFTGTYPSAPSMPTAGTAPYQPGVPPIYPPGSFAPPGAVPGAPQPYPTGVQAYPGAAPPPAGFVGTPGAPYHGQAVPHGSSGYPKQKYGHAGGYPVQVGGVAYAKHGKQ